VSGLFDEEAILMEISASAVKELRERTGVGMMECKKALLEAAGDLGEAEKVLRKRGLAAAARKAGRATGEGAVIPYIHTGGKIGVLVELNCETDFAARSEDFQQLGRNVAMHVAAASPRFLRREDVTPEVLAEEREIARARALASGKPEKVVERIVEGQMEKFYQDNVLLEQPFVKDPERTVGQHIAEVVARIGENVQVSRFCRFVLGDKPAS
jgi:elongation factor Ts